MIGGDTRGTPRNYTALFIFDEHKLFKNDVFYVATQVLKYF